MSCLIIGRKGSVRVANDDDNLEADIICIKPDVEHHVHIPPAGAEIVYFDGLKLSDTCPPFQPLGHEFRALSGAIEAQDRASVEFFRSQLDARTVPIDPAVLRIVSDLYEAPIDRMSQTDLSDRLGLERTQALRHFKANTGQTFRRFKIWAAAIATARQAFNGAAVGSSGLESGFSDAAHVARTSRALFGMTPTQALGKLTRMITI